jgi:hypothetical protein
MSKDANTIKIVGLLVEVAKLDTVYRDVHLRRARQLLRSTLDESAYRAIGSTEKEIDDLVRRGRTAVLQRDWGQVAELSAQTESLRKQLATMSKLANIGKEVYEADTIAFEPFSPGKQSTIAFVDRLSQHGRTVAHAHGGNYHCQQYDPRLFSPAPRFLRTAG